MNVILVGPPGCGKGTQAQKICELYNLAYLSTGNLLREAIAAKTPLGLKAKGIIDAGKLVDDQTILGIVGQFISQTKKGILFDGFPRTLVQAAEIDKLLPIDVVVDIEVRDDVVVQRISSRWMVTTTTEQRTFMNKADAQVFADANNGKMFQRDDDRAEVVRKRLVTYHDQTAPVITHYTASKKLHIVNGEQTIDAVRADIKKVLDEFSGAKVAKIK